MISDLPGPPILSIQQDNSVCFESISPPKFPVEHYELVISDATGEQRLSENTTMNCTSVGNLFDSAVCSPFNVSVKAYNENGHSKVTNLIAGNETGMYVLYRLSL